MTSTFPVIIGCPDCDARYQVAKRACPACGASNPFELPAPDPRLKLVWLGFVGVVLLTVVVFIVTG